VVEEYCILSVRNREGQEYGLVREAVSLDDNLTGEGKLKWAIHRQSRRNSDTFMDDSK
jgi:hypothetical protein